MEYVYITVQVLGAFSSPLSSSPLLSNQLFFFLHDDDEGEIKSFCLRAEGLINRI